MLHQTREKIPAEAVPRIRVIDSRRSIHASRGPIVARAEASGQDVSWLSLEYDTFLSGRSAWVLVLADVLLGKVVDMRAGTFKCLCCDATMNHDLVVHVVLICNRKRDARLSSDIPLFHTPDCGVDKDRVTLVVDPDRRDMRPPCLA